MDKKHSIMSPMYVVAKWLEIGMLPPASVKKVHAAPAPIKKAPLLASR